MGDAIGKVSSSVIAFVVDRSIHSWVDIVDFAYWAGSCIGCTGFGLLLDFFDLCVVFDCWFVVVVAVVVAAVFIVFVIFVIFIVFAIFLIVFMAFVGVASFLSYFHSAMAILVDTVFQY